MKRQDRVEIPATPQIPAFSDQSRRYLGKIIGFSENSVFIVLDEPVTVNDHPEQVVRVSASLPVPVGARFVQGKGWSEIDLRYLCTSGACMNPPTTLVAFEKKEYAIYCDECVAILRQSALFVSATPLAMIGEQKGNKYLVTHERGSNEGIRFVRLAIPPDIRKTVINLLLDHDDLARFTFSRQSPGECILSVPESHRDWLLPKIEEMRESGLTDDDEPNDWFRYKGVLISYVRSRSYWYRVWMEEMEDEKEFDVRDLPTWAEGVAHQQIIKAAIDSGELSPDAEFLDDRSDEE